MPFVFSGDLRRLILKFKEGNARYLRYIFGQMALDAVPKEVWDNVSLLVPIPSSEKSFKERGYNQSELICNEINRVTGIPVATDVLYRTSEVKTKRLKMQERREKIRLSYGYNRLIGDETVLLVDDVCTTGETLKACAEQLKFAGAKTVYCFSVARTELKKQ